LEVYEFWAYVKKKSNKVWLICTYYRSSGEIVAYVCGKRNLKTAGALRNKLSELGFTYTRICADDWRFMAAFKPDTHKWE
jgi:IS1 family transposase